MSCFDHFLYSGNYFRFDNVLPGAGMSRLGIFLVQAYALRVQSKHGTLGRCAGMDGSIV